MKTTSSEVAKTPSSLNDGEGSTSAGTKNELPLVSVGVFLYSEGKYVISSCVAALEGNPDAAIAYGESDWINKDGLPLDRHSGYYDTRGMDPALRLFFAFWRNMHPILGVIRTRCLRAIPKIHACAGTDQIVLAQLAFEGAFVHVPAAGWTRREPRDPETHQQKISRHVSAEFGLAGGLAGQKYPATATAARAIADSMEKPHSPDEKDRRLAGSPAGILAAIPGRKEPRVMSAFAPRSAFCPAAG